MLQDIDSLNNADLGYGSVASLLERFQVVNDDKGRTAEILLNKELSLTLVSGYNVISRHKKAALSGFIDT